jgi:hypothetical protein
LAEEIKKRGGSAPVGLRISALPFKSAQVAIYAPNTGELIGSTPFGAGVAPVFANQKMVFSVPLTELGTDVYTELVRGNTGVPIVITYKFNGLTPPAGFKVQVNWDKAFEHYSKNDEFRARASYYGLWGASGGYSSTKIREQLESAKAIVIDIVEGEGLTQETINSYLQPIVKRINDELLVAMEPPAKIDPAVAPSGGSSGGWFGSASYSSAVKDVKVVKKGTETFDFKYSKLMERASAASGFIGSGKYAKEVIEKITTVVDNSAWERAYLSLPPVPPALSAMDMTVRLRLNEKTIDSQFFKWTPTTSWTDSSARPVDRAVFSLLPVKAGQVKSGEKSATFEISQTVVANNETFALAQTINLHQTGSAVLAPQSAIDVVTIDPSAIRWQEIHPNSKISRVTVSLKAGKRVFRETLRPKMLEGKFAAPDVKQWVLKRPLMPDEEPIVAEINFRIDNKDKVWRSANIRRSNPSLEIFLDELLATDEMYPK